ncbi:hypothetical protein VIRA109638_13055 [Vibrio rarus]
MGIVFFVVIVFFVWLFASKKSRRNSAIEKRVGRMIYGSVESATFEDIYYESAQSYAKSKGATSYNTNNIATNIQINQKMYFVMFHRTHKGGVSISIKY